MHFKMIGTFLLTWILFYLYAMFLMTNDNIFWISSSPEYELFKKMPTFRKKEGYYLEIGGKKYFTKMQYIFKYRVLSVLKDWRDITPAIYGSLIGALILTLIK